MEYRFRDEEGAVRLRAWLEAESKKANGWTKTALTERLGVHRNSIWHWTSGVRRPEEDSREVLEVIAGIPAKVWRTAQERKRRRERLRAA
jgi:transcriptional regulator with XRE-family HTH domain